MATLVQLYEEQARGCIELAEKKHDEPTVRDALLKMARDWMRDAAALRRAERSGSAQDSSDELRSDVTPAA